METVKRLAARVKTSNTSHNNNPALVKKGSVAVEIRDVKRRPRAITRILINNSGLVQVLVLVIVLVPNSGLGSPFKAGRVLGGGAGRRSGKALLEETD